MSFTTLDNDVLHAVNGGRAWANEQSQIARDLRGSGVYHLTTSCTDQDEQGRPQQCQGTYSTFGYGAGISRYGYKATFQDGRLQGHVDSEWKSGD